MICSVARKFYHKMVWRSVEEPDVITKGNQHRHGCTLFCFRPRLSSFIKVVTPPFSNIHTYVPRKAVRLRQLEFVLLTMKCISKAYSNGLAVKPADLAVTQASHNSLTAQSKNKYISTRTQAMSGPCSASCSKGALQAN